MLREVGERDMETLVSMCVSVMCVWVQQHKCLELFGHWAWKCVLTCNNNGTCMPNIKPELYVYVRLCIREYQAVCPTSLLSFQSWPTSSYTVRLILYKFAQPVVATVDPLMCSPSFTVQEGNGELPSFYHKDRSDESLTSTLTMAR